MTFYERILQQISAAGNRGLTLGELERKLGFVSRTDKKELEKALKRLKKNHSVVDNGNGRLAAYSATNLLKGELKGNKRGFAFLIREDKGEDIFIPNKALNGAMHGDTVHARLVGDSEGIVTEVVNRGVTQLVGILFRSGVYYFVQPDDDCYFKDVFIHEDKLSGAKAGEKVVISVKIDGSTNKPYGEIIEVLGKKGERNTEVLAILRNYGFSEQFPEEVLRAAEKIAYASVDRTDIRELQTITIDGDDAKDFDDAISVKKTAHGYKLYVHIADVSHYVKGGGIIDREALDRGTSVYFPESVFPMLPESISNGVCSLRPDEDKLTVTAEMDLNGEGEVVQAAFYESLTRSDFRMTYSDVTKILNGDTKLGEKYGKILPLIQVADELATIITKKRNKNGSINFISHESKIILDDKGEVIDVYPYPYEVSNNIIEQFMITANEAVAAFISKKNLPCVYRVHEPVNEQKLAAFLQFIKGLGYSMDLSKGISPKAFSDLLERVKGSKVERVVNKIMLRSMQKAKYTTVNSGHFGLSLDDYCHFTSPIRRYPDLMVHRVLKAIINKQTSDTFIAKFKTYCEEASTKSSEREIAAERAERDIDDYYKALFMTKHIGENFKGVVSGIVNSGIFVMLDNTVEGFVSIDELPKDRYETDEKNYRITGTKYSFQISDEVEVSIKSADTENRRVDMTLISSVSGHLKKRALN
ncbi:MAG: ribonuclease R [Clostridia bacterium]|nr:ribonuclease R [Clostridia bacterium]